MRTRQIFSISLLFLGLMAAASPAVAGGYGDLVQCSQGSNGNITRAEFASSLNRVFGLSAAGTVTFTDVPKTAAYYNDVIAMAEAGILAGVSATAFQPAATLTHGQADAAIASAFGLSASASTDTSPMGCADAVALFDAYEPWIEIALAQRAPLINVLAADRGGKGADQGNHLDHSGYYKRSLTVNGVVRYVLVYLPTTARLNEHFVDIALPSDALVNRFLMTSRWQRIAEANAVCVRILLPQVNGWGTYAQESAYLASAISSGTYYSSYGLEYLYGAGDGGDLLQEWAANNPMKVISQAFVDSTLSADTLQTDVQNVTYTDTFPMVSAPNVYPNSQVNSAFLPIAAMDVPTPTWLINSEGTQSYWLAVNDCKSAFSVLTGLKLNTQEYDQDKSASNAIATSFSDVYTQVRVSSGSVEYENGTLASNIYGFLSLYTRTNTDSPYSNTLGWRLDFNKAKASGNLVENFDYTLVVNNTGNANAKTPTTTWKRYYVVYVPDQCKKTAKAPCPVEYFFSGGSTPGHVFLEITHGWEFAKKYGFIAVFPNSTGGWNVQDGSWGVVIDSTTGSISDDFSFASHLFDTIAATFNVDTGRVYITGHSMGAIFSNYLGMKFGDKITAMAPVSGPIFGAQPYNTNYTVGTGLTYEIGATTNILPTMFNFGDHDNWPIYVGPWNDSTTGNYWYTGMMNQNGRRINDMYYSYSTQSYWIARNGLNFGNYSITETGLDSPNQIHSSGGFFSAGSPQVAYNAQSAARRYTTYVWKSGGGSGVPLFAWVQCAGRQHSPVISDYEKGWTDWLSHYSMDKAGNRYYSASGTWTDKILIVK